MADQTDIAQRRDTEIRDTAIATTVAGIRIANAMPGLHECERCGDKIGADRLKAVPSARRCTVCQAELENQQGVR